MQVEVAAPQMAQGASQPGQLKSDSSAKNNKDNLLIVFSTK